MKWKLIKHLLGAIFLLALLIFAGYTLVPFVRYLASSSPAETALPSALKEDPKAIQQRATNVMHYFEPGILANDHEVVKTLNEVPLQNGWFNTAPLDLSYLAGEGHIILLHFWHYADFKSDQMMPYLNSLWQRYHSYGLVIIGVHSPQYPFEKAPTNVWNSVQDLGIKFPVVTDGEKRIGQQFSRHIYPMDYLINTKGEVIYQQWGDKNRLQLEENIRQALEKEGWELPKPIATIPKPKISSENNYLPDMYLGPNLIRRRLGNEIQPELNKSQFFTYPKSMINQGVYLQGQWKAFPEYLLAQTPGEITVIYRGGAVYPVLGQGAYPIWVEVRLEGEPIPTTRRGRDILVHQGKTYLSIVSPRLYFPLIPAKDPKQLEQLTLIYPATLEAYGFMF